MSAVTPSLDAPDELREALEPLLPKLAGQGVERLLVFSYGRPGEGLFWQAYLFVGNKRHCLGTSELRQRSLEDQVRDLVRQLDAFDSPNASGTDLLEDWSNTAGSIDFRHR